MSTECCICCEAFTAKLRSVVDCNFCENPPVCKQCTQEYLLTIKNDPHCMHCKAAWNREFVSSVCTASFMSGPLRRHREDVLCERERSLLPATQEQANRTLRIRQRDKRVKELEAEQDVFRKEIQKIGQKIAELYRDERARGEGGSGTDRAFVYKCTWPDCKGFVDSAFRCPLGDHSICKHCHEPVEEDTEHTCDPGIVENIKSMARNTRPCPTCGMGIFKVDGCDQMWCTQCHQAFSWRTGAIETKVVHNPHFYEFMQQGGGPRTRNPLDVRCGGLPEVWSIYDKTRDPMLLGVHRFIAHMTYSEIPNITAGLDVADANEHLRIAFLLGDIQEAEWKSQLQRTEKRRDKKRELSMLYIMVRDVMTEAFIEFCADGKTVEEVLQVWHHLQTYANEHLTKIAKRFNNKATKIVVEEYGGERKYVFLQ